MGKIFITRSTPWSLFHKLSPENTNNSSAKLFFNPPLESDPRKEQAMQIKKIAKTRFLSLGISFLLAVSLMMVPHDAQAGATRVELEDACLIISAAFCTGGGAGNERHFRVHAWLRNS